MNNGKFVYSKPGSDEAIGEVNYAQYHLLQARIALSKGGVKYPDSFSVMLLAGLIAGEGAGVYDVEIGNLRNVDEAAIADTLKRLNIDIDLVTEGEDEAEEVPEADANPTDTSGENC